MKSATILMYLSIVSQLAHLVVAGSAYTSRQATFIPPAAPVATRVSASNNMQPTETLSFARSQMIAGGYGLYPSSTPTTTTLFAKKKKAAPAVSKKIQVKMLKHVAGTGQAGQVVMVTPAFFNNKLRPQQAAKIISDEEVAEEASDAQAKEAAERAKAEELKEKLDDLELVLTRKAGPDGHLFGGIGPKVIMKELHTKIGDDFLEQKWVKISEMLDEDGKKMRGDIKTTGSFGSRINLLKGISAKIGITVQAEE